MMSEAQTLNRSQKLKAVGSAVKKRPLKIVLCNPYNPVWPNIERRNQEEILKLLERYCCLSKEGTRRSHVLLGMNKVTRSLDHDLLSLVVVDRSAPWQLHRHLVSQCAVRECPAGAVDGLAAALCPLLGVTRLSAIGFNKKCSPCEDKVKAEEISGFISNVIELLPSISLPWLEFSKSLDTADNISSISQSISIYPETFCTDDNCQSSDSSEENISKSKLISCDTSDSASKIDYDTRCNTSADFLKIITSTGYASEKLAFNGVLSNKSSSDYSHLYIYKANKVAEKKTFNADFLKLPVEDSDSSSDEGSSLWTADSGVDAVIVRRSPALHSSHHTPNRKQSSRTPISGYRRTNIGKMQGKEAGTKKKKKIDKKAKNGV